MAKTTQFLFTNKSSASVEVTPYALDLIGNYAVQTDLANEAALNNKTAPIDAMEIITFRSRNLDKVNHNLNIQNPSKVPGGIQYGVQVEDTAVTTDSGDATFRVDEPIVVSITVRHPKSGNITNDLVAETVTRAVSALRRADGSWRFDDLMRSAERPVVA